MAAHPVGTGTTPGNPDSSRAPGVVIYPDRFPPAAAARIAGKLLNRHSPIEIAEAITVLIDVLDLIGGDPDAEEGDPLEANGDERDLSWRNTIAQRPGMVGAEGAEDDEDDDPDHEQDGRELEALP